MQMNFNHMPEDMVSTSDFTRIEQATSALQKMLTASGTDVDTTSAAWSRTVFPTPMQIDRIHDNITYLHQRFCYLPDFRPLVPQYRTDRNRTFTARGLNAIEYNLHTLALHLEAMQEAYEMRHADTLQMQAGGMLNEG